uniref:Large ribosomal subunit protein uL3c n=1 Tax=Chondria tumulosa TaxID=2740715 RepID=A0A896SPZ6_9FLOR|nr:ribosomal protein L3 [Chondria tumulosa]QSD57142.1 ribosomal protein L3 [Chondria tumulosa]
MVLGILGKKVGMTQIFNSEGSAIQATILKVGPCTVTQITNKLTNTKTNIQIGYEYINPNKLTKSKLGYFKKYKIPCFKYLREYAINNNELKNVKLGKIINIDTLKVGKYVNISGTSTGKGFSGYQKRHNFNRGPMSHGSKNHRQPGSIGAGTTPGRVFPGKRMAGQMGNKKVSIRNLKIIKINKNNNILVIKGSVPGKNGNLIYIYNK